MTLTLKGFEDDAKCSSAVNLIQGIFLNETDLRKRLMQNKTVKHTFQNHLTITCDVCGQGENTDIYMSHICHNVTKCEM